VLVPKPAHVTVKVAFPHAPSVATDVFELDQ
jgi:hypothetical protein